MKWGALLVCTMGLAAASCAVNQTDGTCLTAESSTCVSQCSRRQSNETCSALAGCNWNISSFNCRPSNASLHSTCLSMGSNSSACESISGCFPQPETCQSSVECQSANSSDLACSSTQNTSACETHGPQCRRVASCATVPRCSLGSQSSCTATVGCYWYEGSTTDSSNATLYAAACSACYADPGYNSFLVAQTLAGYSCTVIGTNNGSTVTIIRNFTLVISAATGCDGGVLPLSRDDLLRNCIAFNGTGAPTPATNGTAPTNAATNETDTTSSATSIGLPVISAFAVFFVALVA